MGKRWQKITLCCVLAVGVLVVGLWTGVAKFGWFDRSVAITSSPSADQILSDMSKNLTEQLINDAIAYKNADGASRETALSTLHQTAAKRQQYIKTLMQEDPDAFLSLAISQDIKQELLQGIEGIETNVALGGELKLIAEETSDHDSHDQDCATLFFLVLPSGETKSLFLPTSVPVAYNPNDIIQTVGFELDGTFVPNTVADPGNFIVIAGGIEASDNMASLSTFGTRKIAVILVNVNNAAITDNAEHAFTPSGALQMFDAAKNYYEENSYGQVSLSGKLNPAKSADVFGVYNVTTENIPNDYNCNLYYNDWYNQGTAAAATDGFVNSGYDHVLVWINKPPYTVTPFNICNWNGRADVTGSKIYQWSYAGASTAIHEMGHNLGLPHASSFENCTISGQGVSFAKAEDCSTFREYGDFYSAMGTGETRGSPTVHFDAIEKVKLGWIPATNVTTVTASGTHVVNLYPSEQSSTGTQLIRIPMPYDIVPRSGTIIYQGEAPFYYYLELRKPVGIDGNGLSQFKEDFNGVFLRTGSGSTTFTYASNYLWSLGALPGAEACYLDRCTTGLRPGMVFADPYNPDMTIKVLSWTPDKATVEITLTKDVEPTVCVRREPTVVVDPLSATVEPGGSAKYVVTATNNDSGGCNHSGHTFKSGTPPSGFQVSAGGTKGDLQPGDSSSQEFTVASPSTVASGIYTITFTVTNLNSNTTVARDASFIVASTNATPPTIVVTGITNGGTINPNANTKIAATATHAEGISKVEIHIDNQLVAKCNEPKNGICDVFVKGSNVVSGTHTLKVTATAKDTGQTNGTANLSFGR